MKRKTVYSIEASAISECGFDEWGYLLIAPTPPGKLKVTVGRWDKDTHEFTGFRYYTTGHKRYATLLSKFQERRK
jgi:hypothetical protein